MQQPHFPSTEQARPQHVDGCRRAILDDFPLSIRPRALARQSLWEYVCVHSYPSMNADSIKKYDLCFKCFLAPAPVSRATQQPFNQVVCMTEMLYSSSRRGGQGGLVCCSISSGSQRTEAAQGKLGPLFSFQMLLVKCRRGRGHASA